MEQFTQVILVIIPTVLGWLVGWLLAKYKKAKERAQSLADLEAAYKESIKYMLRKSLKEDSEYYIQRGYCSIEDKNEVEVAYDLYHNKLKANGPGTRYYQAIMSLPDHKPEE